MNASADMQFVALLSTIGPLCAGEMINLSASPFAHSVLTPSCTIKPIATLACQPTTKCQQTVQYPMVNYVRHCSEEHHVNAGDDKRVDERQHQFVR
jgi:hypothetical protein